MRIAVAGLGIIGTSIARSLKKTEKYVVDGLNRSESVTRTAIKNGFIDGVAENLSSYDVVFVCLPPESAIEFINKTQFMDNAIVADICGVKGIIEENVLSKPRNFSYVGTHPMAGKETRGIESSSDDLFHGASMIITVNGETKLSAVDVIESLSRDMGFGRIVKCSAEYHDKKIALTSQLAHIVSNAYVKSRQIEDCEGFTGGSFQDMTRIAGVDENVWTELYFMNRENLLDEVERLIEDLTVYRDALKNKDEEKMRLALKEGRLIREGIKSGRK